MHGQFKKIVAIIDTSKFEILESQTVWLGRIITDFYRKTFFVTFATLWMYLELKE